MGGRGSDLLRLRAKVTSQSTFLAHSSAYTSMMASARRLVAAAKATHVGLERLRVIDGAHQLHARYRVAAGMCLGRLLQEQDLGSLVGRGDGRVGARAAKARHNDVVFGIPLDGLLKGGCLSGLLRHGKRGRGAAGQDGSRGAGDKALLVISIVFSSLWSDGPRRTWRAGDDVDAHGMQRKDKGPHMKGPEFCF